MATAMKNAQTRCLIKQEIFSCGSKIWHCPTRCKLGPGFKRICLNNEVYTFSILESRPERYGGLSA